MKKILQCIAKYIPEILITAGAAVILGLIIYLNVLAGLFSLGLVLVMAGFFAAKARG